MFCRHKGGHSLMTPPSVLDSIDIHHVELQHTPPKTATTPRREKHRSYWRKTSCEVPREMEKVNLQTSGQLAAETAMTAVNPPRAKNEPHRVLPAGEAGRSHIYRARRKTLPGPFGAHSTHRHPRLPRHRTDLPLTEDPIKRPRARTHIFVHEVSRLPD